MEFIDGGSAVISKQPKENKKAQNTSKSSRSVQIPRPTKQAVTEYLDKWALLQKYPEQEDALSLLFKETFPHNPLDFPIYDIYVEKLLIHFRNVDRFSIFRNEELRNFLVFKRVISDFREAYQLDDFNLKQIDQYLWQFGKDTFPKNY